MGWGRDEVWESRQSAGSAVKNTGCFYRGTWFGGQLTTACNFSSKAFDAFSGFLTKLGI